ncbi:MAG TPA: NAD-dependent epimerase/dehydratase family protein [Acidimicrobiales bacterium]|nr:NAD-dependent epimerase/dehydratase family protein [Acidimicrobiales bacterium]
MKVVVTGGAGFIGANLCRRLASSSPVSQVVAFDDLSTGLAANLDGIAAELFEGSILHPDELDAALAGAAAVVHLAARPSVPRSLADPIATHEVNATGTVRVLEAARRAGNPHVIVTSSSSVYGSNSCLPKHEDLAPAPLSPYAASKLATESYALAWASSFGLDVLAFRLFNVFGPLQPAGHAYAAVVPAFVEAALAGEALVVHGDGLQTRDFTYVDSVTEVITAAVTDRVSAPGPVNLAFGGRSSVMQLIGLLESVLGRELERRHVEARPGDVRDSQADQGRLRALFPSIEAVGLREGLARTVAWFEERERGELLPARRS